jgi:hypothetical protein
MSKILVDTIDTRSGTSNITIGSSNASQITLKSGATLTNFPDNSPAFKAYLGSNQSLNNSTATTIGYNTETFDLGGCYNHTGATATLNSISVPAYSFAPNVSGKYFFVASVRIDASVGFPNDAYLEFYRNGAAIETKQREATGANVGGTLYIQNVVEMNGTSDYIQMRITVYNGNTSFISNYRNSAVFIGYKLIGV